ncbi:MAG: DUF1570 domain-containing protein [Peptococcaceae bacterium]|nr:DUF1570 domain-containing protein [Peptococcaceae bacterium]
MVLRLSTVWAGVAAAASSAGGLDYVTVRVGDDQRPIAGRVEIEAEDGGVLLLARDGALWAVKKEDLIARRSDAKPFAPLTREELARQLQGELPGFRVHTTQHYLICYNTSPAYARWVGGLFEGLYKAFYNYWTRRGAVLHDPPFPLVAVVFDAQAAFQKHARGELGEAAQSIIGYYNLHTNRMTMYDLTGVEAAGGNERTASARIQQILSQPGAERTVATIVHEATHQLAFNSGLQVRFADVPLWVSEGIAIYFETPNLESTKGWRNVGAVNRFNLVNFRKYLPRRPPGRLGRSLCSGTSLHAASLPGVPGDGYRQSIVSLGAQRIVPGHSRHASVTVRTRTIARTNGRPYVITSPYNGLGGPQHGPRRNLRCSM